jgi:hypothetical protein
LLQVTDSGLVLNLNWVAVLGVVVLLGAGSFAPSREYLSAQFLSREEFLSGEVLSRAFLSGNSERSESSASETTKSVERTSTVGGSIGPAVKEPVKETASSTVGGSVGPAVKEPVKATASSTSDTKSKESARSTSTIRSGRAL